MNFSQKQKLFGQKALGLRIQIKI